MHSVILAPHNGKTVVIVVFHGDALRRLEKNDPAIVEGNLIPSLLVQGHYAGDAMNLNTTDFLFAYEPDQQDFEAKCRQLGDQRAILKWLGRGWENKPEERDSVIKVTRLNEDR
jgi:predicted lipase